MLTHDAIDFFVISPFKILPIGIKNFIFDRYDEVCYLLKRYKSLL